MIQLMLITASTSSNYRRQSPLNKEIHVVKRMNNKGFSLVELIIAMAIMAVLVGVLAPQYMKYLEKTRRVADCSAISTILDACEVIAGDPDVVWSDGEKIIVTIADTGTTYVGGPSSTLNVFVPKSDMVMKSNYWGTIRIEAIKEGGSRVAFNMSDDLIETVRDYSEAVAERFE